MKVYDQDGVIYVEGEHLTLAITEDALTMNQLERARFIADAITPSRCFRTTFSGGEIDQSYKVHETKPDPYQVGEMVSPKELTVFPPPYGTVILCRDFPYVYKNGSWMADGEDRDAIVKAQHEAIIIHIPNN